jgi:hypothetical protein
MKLLALCIGVLAVLTTGATPPAATATTPSTVAGPDDAMPTGAVPKSCVFKGKKLWGKVQIVNSFPDFKVEKVTSFPDLKVQEVSSFPDKCGKWQFVTSFPDFKIQYVKSFPDFKIQKVQSFPGVP